MPLGLFVSRCTGSIGQTRWRVRKNRFSPDNVRSTSAQRKPSVANSGGLCYCATMLLCFEATLNGRR